MTTTTTEQLPQIVKHFLSLYADELDAVTADTIFEWWSQTKDQYPGASYDAIEDALMLIKQCGGVLVGDRLYFSFDAPVCAEGGPIELPEAAFIETQLMEKGFAGALIGTPFNDLDPKGIFFELK